MLDDRGLMVLESADSLPFPKCLVPSPEEGPDHAIGHREVCLLPHTLVSLTLLFSGVL